VAQFGYFVDEDDKYAEFRGLFAPLVTTPEMTKDLRKQEPIRECFEQAKNLNIVITGLGSSEDPHSAFNQLTKTYPELKTKASRTWVGDVQFLLYSATGPLPKAPEEPGVFTVVTLQGLKQLSKERRGHVVLVCGPCGSPDCGKTKTTALLPLLREPELSIFTDLFLDLKTAEELACA
jgi:DNA-binding transcriptional regulator LsrR (DeoR family)